MEIYQTKRSRMWTLAKLLGLTGSALASVLVAAACEGSVVQSKASTEATVDVYETVDAVTGERGWKVEIKKPHADYVGEYLVRSYSSDGDLVNERSVSSWHSLVPGVSEQAAQLAADPGFRKRMDEMRRAGLSTSERVDRIVDGLVESGRWEDGR
ncbi:MAG: hypothetical protein OXI83_10415 [Gemmatimonadota bacterium]|nr:hypothetical protein [Gemmatimonadota bacterium]